MFGGDMSRLMETYDPNWDARWQIAHDAFTELQRATGDGLSSAQIAACQKRSNELLVEMQDAYVAQFRTVVDYAAFHWKELERSLTIANKDLPWPVFGADATREDVIYAYREFVRRFEQLKAFDFLEAPAEWEEAIFREELPAGVRREIFDREFEEKGRQTVMARLVVERHPEGVHCCAIDHPGMRTSVKARITGIANQLRSELRRDKAGRTLSRWLVRPPPITFYAYAPQMFWNTPADHVSEVSFEVSRGVYESPKWRGMNSVPPLLRRLALDTDAEFRHLLSVQPRGSE
jgi:hypothetical protein